jgi:hypothetical protein
LAPTRPGSCPRGKYTATGTYGLLTDAHDITPMLKLMKKGGKEITPEMMKKLEKMRDNLSYRAFVEGFKGWEDKWPLKITDEKGWLPAAQSARVKRKLEKAMSEAAKALREAGREP